MGVKPGGMKGNIQKAKYRKPEKKHGKPGGREGGKRGNRKEEPKHCGSHCEAEAGRGERKKQRLSSEMLTRKRTKESGSQAPAPERKLERGSPVEQLRERSRAGRKETISKPSTKTGRERMGNQPGRNGESKEATAERQHRGSHCEAETGSAERKTQRAQ